MLTNEGFVSDVGTFVLSFDGDERRDLSSPFPSVLQEIINIPRSSSLSLDQPLGWSRNLASPGITQNTMRKKWQCCCLVSSWTAPLTMVYSWSTLQWTSVTQSLILTHSSTYSLILSLHLLDHSVTYSLTHSIITHFLTLSPRLNRTLTLPLFFPLTHVQC